jgi:hypothetical protein
MRKWAKRKPAVTAVAGAFLLIVVHPAQAFLSIHAALRTWTRCTSCAPLQRCLQLRRFRTIKCVKSKRTLTEFTNELQPVMPITHKTRFQETLALLVILTASSTGLEFQAIPIGESWCLGTTDFFIGKWRHPNLQYLRRRYDQSTFIGRYCKMLLACDPRLLLYTVEEMCKYHKLAYKGYNRVQAKWTTIAGTETNRILWEAKRIADLVLNSQQEWILRPFQMSG